MSRVFPPRNCTQFICKIFERHLRVHPATITTRLPWFRCHTMWIFLLASHKFLVPMAKWWESFSRHEWPAWFVVVSIVRSCHASFQRISACRSSSQRSLFSWYRRGSFVPSATGGTTHVVRIWQWCYHMRRFEFGRPARLFVLRDGSLVHKSADLGWGARMDRDWAGEFVLIFLPISRILHRLTTRIYAVLCHI